ncbi:amidohydrolase family protein [Prosthecomicrobium sp. N25]|uniref:amidohydrolase family protein n=1 Tax=Prosthecomicrobium sp. N25 TaxID=3129254 RepID=UPI003078480A
MIVDAHCHAWETWPYDEPVPDRESRGRVEQLLYEMDRAGVAKAVVVCAGLGGNLGNNAYAHDAARRHPGRLVPFADVDSRWLDTHKTAGAAARLRQAAEAFGLAGFTHYLWETDDGSWLVGDEGSAFLAEAERSNLILSLACTPDHMPVVERIAERTPIPILCHHMVRVRAGVPRDTGLPAVLAAARHPNVYVKVSGFGYAGAAGEHFPYPSLTWLTRALYEVFGPERLCWGSDYPVSRRYMTYPQSLEVARRHFDFAPEADRALILGGTMARLLSERGA